MSDQLVNHAKDFANGITLERFKKSNKFQMKKETYRRDMLSAYVAGYITLCQSILQTDHREPFGTAPELIGAIHLNLKQMWEFYSENEGVHRPFNIEEIIKYGHSDMLSALNERK